ncbi:galactose metabolism-related protein [Marasmius crinis-equi]|uniref:Galactose metabolism-related protein n=1 Tax=Marasmius crinis-equi TaxID=585013 RepID=A0ABR3FTA7_9AGAR
MGNTASQQQNSHSNTNALRRFSSPRHHHSPKSSSTSSRRASVPITSSHDGQDGKDSRKSRDKDRDREGRERDGKHHVHRSLRVKKKSLELPDLAPLELNPYQHQPTSIASSRASFAGGKSPSIPIPLQQDSSASHRHKTSITAVDYYQPTQPQTYQSSSTTKNQQQYAQPVSIATPRPPYPSPAPSPSLFPPSSVTPTSNGTTPFSSRDPSSIFTPGDGDVTVTGISSETDITAIQEAKYVVVESSQFNPLVGDPAEELQAPVIPLPLPVLPLPEPLPTSIPDKPSNSDSQEEIMVKISWHGGGSDVFLARQGDEKYMNKVRMEREGSTNTFSTSLPLAPGTHHIRFFVDEQWRVADDLPATVDDLGGLANYVAVGPGFAYKTLPGSPTTLSQPTSTTASVILPATPRQRAEMHSQREKEKQTRKPVVTHGYSFWDQPDDDDDDGEGGGRGAAEARRVPSPPHAKAVSPGPGPSRQGTLAAYEPQWTNEIPLELIEAAAEEEAYLAHQEAHSHHHSYSYHSQRNSRKTTHQIHGFMPLPNIPPAPRLPRILEKLILNQQSAAQAGIRPAPPTGGTSAPLAGASLASPGRMQVGIPTYSRDRERDRGDRDRERERVRSPFRDKDRRERERDKRSLGMTPTPTPTYQDEREREGRPLPVTTASGTDVSAQREREGGRDREREREREREGRPLSPLSRGDRDRDRERDRDRDRETGRHPHVVDNRTIADDSSVLPVPSHVVIHHLCTSAIKNGVLGVGGTTRYKQKYMTTVFYKPT